MFGEASLFSKFVEREGNLAELTNKLFVSDGFVEDREVDHAVWVTELSLEVGDFGA